MAIKRYTANSDTTITDAYKENLSTRGTGSNMGASDITEVFSIYGQLSSSADGPTLERSRALLQFPVTNIATDRTAGTVPASGSVNFFLRMFNAEHHETLPANYSAAVLAVSQSWTEGTGLDMDNYKDVDSSNWIHRSADTNWGNGAASTQGGVYHTGSIPFVVGVKDHTSEIIYKQTFGDEGTEDIEIDITPLVEHWLAGTVANNGVGVMMSGTYEDGTAKRSYYSKKFFARTSEYFFKRPVIEARWDSSKSDDRSNFYASSNLASTSANTNTIYLYNYIRGNLANIPSLHASNTLDVKLYRGALTDDTPTSAVGGLTSDTGIYTASVTMDTSASVVYDVWGTGSNASEKLFYTGSITPQSFIASADNPNQLYVTSLPNLKSSYSTRETARFRFFTRKQNWSPTIYTKATEVSNSDIVESAYYKLYRVSDGHEVIPYGTGSIQQTKMSYDQSGSYFDLDMKLLEPDCSYGLSVSYYLNGKYVEQPEIFKFRVEE